MAIRIWTINGASHDFRHDDDGLTAERLISMLGETVDYSRDRTRLWLDTTDGGMVNMDHVVYLQTIPPAPPPADHESDYK